MLSPRLRALASLIPPGARVADIGSDHAYLPIYLATQGFPTPIAVENQSGPLEQSRVNVARHGCDVDVRLGWGLEPINPGEVDWVVIAGMSGATIVEILQESREKLCSFAALLLQPMQDASRIRRFAGNLSVAIADEWVIREGRQFYEIIKLVGANPNLPDLHLPTELKDVDEELVQVAGPRLCRKPSPVIAAYWADKVCRLERAVKACQRGGACSQAASLESQLEAWRMLLTKYKQFLARSSVET